MDRIQLRRDSSARWAEINPILLEGEVGFETDTKLRKIGDGIHHWNDLEYLKAEGISQETGNSQNITMSQDAITKELSELGSKVKGNTFICSNNTFSLKRIEELIVNESYNLFNKNDEQIIDGSYINKENSIASNSSYIISGYIPVEENTNYKFGSSNEGKPQARTLEFYDSKGSVIVGSFIGDSSSEIISPQGASFLRCSVSKSLIDTFQITANEYMPYKAFNGGKKYKDSSVNLNALSDRVSKILKGNEIGASKLSVAYNEYLSLDVEGLINKGDKFSVLINSATSEERLIIQTRGQETTTIRLQDYAKVGVNYSFTAPENLKTIIISNYGSISVDIDMTLKLQIASAVEGLNTAVEGLNTAVEGLNTAVEGLNTAVEGLNTAVGFIVEGYNNSYTVVASGLKIPIGTKIVNKGVTAVLFNEDKSQRLDCATGQEKITTFEVYSIQGSSTAGEIIVEVRGLKNVSEENEEYIKGLDSRIGVNITKDVLEDTIDAKKVYKGFLPKGTKVKVTINPIDVEPNRFTLYFSTNTPTDRIYDSAIDSYGVEKTVILSEDINNLYVFTSGFQPVSVRIITFGSIRVDSSNIEDGSITEEKLSEEVKSIIKSPKRINFKSFRESAVLESGSYLTLGQNHIGKNFTLVGRFSNAFDSISIGVGYSSNTTYKNRGYAAAWVDIDAENVKQYRYYNADYVLIDTKPHGINITETTVVEISAEITESKLKIYDNIGNVYEQALQVGCGTPFVYNGGGTSLTVALSFFPKELKAIIWAFGDSYFNFINNNRWPYYFAQAGNINWLSNNQPGLSPESAYNDLVSLLTLGCIPRYLVWCLGMNGDTSESTDSEGNYIINDYQKTNIDKVVELCNLYDIELILATIPTVPTRQKTGFNNYVKSVGVRYIDFAKSVGATSEGVWNDGLLSSDGVHPSVKGAIVLASQAMVDAPELTTKVY